MRLQLARPLIAAASLLAAVAVSASATAAPVSLRAFAAEQMRLEAIGYRIGVGSAAMCSEREMYTGMVVHDLSQYDLSVRPAVAHAFSLGAGVGVIQIVPGSAASRSGLRIDDEILAVDSRSVLNEAATVQRQKSYARIQQFKALLKTALLGGPADLLVRRSGTLLRVQLAGEPGCGGQLSLIDSREANGWSDGSNVIVTTGMSQLAKSDDEIAFVVAHEMAHNILAHARSSSPQLFGLSLGVGKVRKSELDADRLAVTLMRHGGYRAEAGVSVLQVASRRYWWAVSLDHPGFGRRIREVNAAIADMPSYGRDPVNVAQSGRPVTPVLALSAAAVQVAASGLDASRNIQILESPPARLRRPTS
ncbi:MAG TPA: M48 family metallopeptidase [Sphingomicrobium sp.]|jgi:hypothetical protein